MTLPKVAYFCMEMAIDQSLYTYSGGLGYLAGSHMYSAGQLNLPMVGVTILWSYGYGEQFVNESNEVDLRYDQRSYPFLQNTGVTVVINIFGEPVRVKAFLLPPEQFGTAPIYYLTTDIPQNKPEHRKITQVLYAGDQRTRIAQEIVLGVGGLRVLKASAVHTNVVHMNEGHALPAAFELLDEFGGDLEQVRNRLVFTTHTPVAAGNETHPAHLLHEAGFFVNTPLERAIQLGGEDFCLTVAALRMSRLANGVSQLHGEVAKNMWSWVHDRCPIIAITNAANRKYWQDKRITEAVKKPEALLTLKKQMKTELFERVERETGKRFDPDILTIVWSRRFTEYKRAWLLFYDQDRLVRLLSENKIQLLFAGKYHPSDEAGHQMFNTIIRHSQTLPNIGILMNYELELSAQLKRGADVWLNTPLRPMEASGTSGMSANMNGAIHCSIFDGWAVEGTFHDINGYLINEQRADEYVPIEERHRQDHESLMEILEQKIIPTYYENPQEWARMMQLAIATSESFFNSDRMVIEYFTRFYKPVTL
ncbi:MAG: alpha-glucan family phosphorylase [Vampirovibrionales bacterium]|nr:alpha-glucan family phosphorylase [Vampirovibrionales bacterium]